jgi:hypothetical protein
MEAIRALQRRLSDIVYRHMLDDAISPAAAGMIPAGATGPGGHTGATTSSNAVDSNPASTLRRSHVPDPPPTSLRPHYQQPLEQRCPYDRSQAAADFVAASGRGRDRAGW